MTERDRVMDEEIGNALHGFVLQALGGLEFWAGNNPHVKTQALADALEGLRRADYAVRSMARNTRYRPRKTAEEPAAEVSESECLKADGNPIHTLLGHDHIGHRVYNALKREGLRTVEEVQEKDAYWFLDQRGIGDVGLARIRTALARNREKEKHGEA